MSLYEYLQLDINYRADYLWKHGEHLFNYVTRSERIPFYLLGGFYVAVALKDDSTGIKTLTPFNQGDMIEKMTDAIDLPTL